MNSCIFKIEQLHFQNRTLYLVVKMHIYDLTWPVFFQALLRNRVQDHTARASRAQPLRRDRTPPSSSSSSYFPHDDKLCCRSSRFPKTSPDFGDQFSIFKLLPKCSPENCPREKKTFSSFSELESRLFYGILFVRSCELVSCSPKQAV